jgi:hypothetical protein
MPIKESTGLKECLNLGTCGKCLNYSMANGGIITLDAKQGIEYNLPPLPPESEILYYTLKPKDQYWRSSADLTRELDIRDVRKMNEREKIGYIEKWRHRWSQGLHFMNNGVPTYMNGMNVDHLIFNKFNNRFLRYNRSQRDDFLFREWIWHMDEVDGAQWIKPRRYGMSTEEVTQSIYVLLSDFNNNVGFQSDTRDKALKTLLTPLIDAYCSRPFWMREDYYRSNGKRPQSSLKLVNNKDDGTQSEDDSWLGGKVFIYPTEEKAQDGVENIYSVIDEFSKHPTGKNPRQTMETNRKTIRNAGRRGKLSALSTTGDSDSVMDSIKEWIKLAGESTLIPGQKNTISGLVKRFVNSLWTQYLPEELLPDRYGEIDQARNEEWIHNEVNKKPKGTKEYYYEKRKLPLTEDEALISASEGSYFDKIRIIARRKYIQSLLPEDKPYFRGRLEPNSTGRIYFEQDHDGLWLISLHPFYSVDQRIDARNRFKRGLDGEFHQPLNPEFYIGYDPVRYKKEDIKSSNFSRASVIVHKRFDYFNKPDSEHFVEDEKAALFLGRMDDPKDVHRECVKACKYFGAPCMHERQVESVKEIFEEEKMIRFLMTNEKDGGYGIWTDSQGKIVKNGVEMLQSRYRVPKKEDEKDHIEIYPFEDGLIDLENFDMANTTSFDVTMSEIMLEYALKQAKRTNVSDDAVRSYMQRVHQITPPLR